jgi:hypothetical protein
MADGGEEEDMLSASGDDSGGSESSDSDSEGGGGGGNDGGVGDADLAAVMALEQSLQTHPYDYALHAQYVALLRRCRLRGRVRAARDAQAALFPLTEQQWREWVEDEIDAAERCARERVQAHCSACSACSTPALRRSAQTSERTSA